MMGVPSASTSPQHHVLEMPPLRCDVPFLVRYGSGGFQGPPTNGISCPEQLVKLCAANGLFVRQTVTDGNCGLDAFEQALCSLPNGRTMHNQSKMRGLAKAKASSQSLLFLREQALLYIKDNRKTQMWEGMSLEQLVLAMSQDTTGGIDGYISRMSENYQWIDACVIHALGCVFKVDVVIFQTSIDPAFVGKSTNVEGTAATSTIAVALQNDRHFWAAVPMKEETGSVDMAIVHAIDSNDFLKRHHSQQNQPDADSDSDGFEQIRVLPDVFIPPYALDEKTADAELDMIFALREWNHFDDVPSKVISAVGTLAKCYEEEPDQMMHKDKMPLVRQETWTALSMESQGAARLTADSDYHGVARWKLRTKQCIRGRRDKVSGLIARLRDATTTDKIKTSLESCRTAFCCAQQCAAKFGVDEVKTWRVLWLSTPNHAQHEVLTQKIREQFLEYRKTPIREFHVRFRVLGKDVCRRAFIGVTGISDSFIAACKADAIQGRASYNAFYDCSFEGQGGPRSNQRKAGYLDACCWIKEYARTHACQSPITGNYELPAGRKMFYWACYCWDREKHKIEPAALSTFREAWRIECSHVKITTSVNKFTQCGLCLYLKNQMDLCPRANQSLLNALRQRLGKHFQFQSAQRVRVDAIMERCRQSNGTQWFFTIDKMDQTATICPTFWSLLSSPLFKLGTRLVCGVVGSEWSGPFRSQMLLRSVFQDMTGGSETQCSIVLTNLLHIATKEGRLPTEVIMNPDNTPKESKNKIMLWFQIWLLCVLRDTCFYSFSSVFLIVGHTHNSLDRFFSRLSVSLRGHNYDTVDEMWDIIKTALRSFDIDTMHTKQTWAFKELGESLPAIRRLHYVHAVNVFRTRQGIFIKWKQYVTDDQWSEPQCVVHARKMATIAGLRPASVAKHFAERDMMLSWLDKYEGALTDWQNTINKHKEGIEWLKRTIEHRNEDYNSETTLDDIVTKLITLGQGQPSLRPVEIEIPDDQLVSLFPGADLPNVPVNTLVAIDGIHPRSAPPPVPMQGHLVIFQAGLLWVRKVSMGNKVSG